MTISSIIVVTNPENSEKVILNLKNSGLCEFNYSDDTGKIIITLEGNSIADEIYKINEIKKIEGIISVEPVYSYIKNGVQRLRENPNTAPTFDTHFQSDSL